MTQCHKALLVGAILGQSKALVTQCHKVVGDVRQSSLRGPAFGNASLVVVPLLMTGRVSGPPCVPDARIPFGSDASLIVSGTGVASVTPDPLDRRTGSRYGLTAHRIEARRGHRMNRFERAVYDCMIPTAELLEETTAPSRDAAQLLAPRTPRRRWRVREDRGAPT